jgi:hypothetical protein
MPSSAIEFSKSDNEYQDWLENHPEGFVLNMHRRKLATYMRLHRATCPYISNYTQMAKKGGFTEREYIKVCADDVSALRAWVKSNGRPDGSFSGECGSCRPT